MKFNKFSLIVGIFIALAITVTHFITSGSRGVEKRRFQTTLQLQWFDQAQFAGFYMAKDQNYNMDEGLEVKIASGGYSTNPIANLVNNAADFAIAPADAALLAIAKGEPVTMIGAVFRESVVCYMSKSGQKIRGPQDLKGKKVGVYRSFDTENILRILMKKHGITEEEITIVDATDTTHFEKGHLDVHPAYIFNEPVKMGLKEIEVECLVPSDHGVPYYSDTILVRDNFLKENPKIVESFIKATKKGWNFSIKNPSQTIDRMFNMGLNFDPSNSLERAIQTGMLGKVIQYVETEKPDDLLTINEEKISAMSTLLFDVGLFGDLSKDEVKKKIDEKIDFKVAAKITTTVQ